MDHLGSLKIDSSVNLGRKAFCLHFLKMRNFPVPPGFIISYEDYLELREKKDSKLQSMIDVLGGFPVAVRSSGQLEDLQGASFAGLYETFLDVGTGKDLWDAIGKCFDSIYSPRVMDYLKKKNISLSDDLRNEN